MWIGVITITISLLIYLVWVGSGGRPAQRRRFSGSFRSVSIEPAERTGCCPVCDSLRERRFLLGHAPRLPLQQCLAPQCNCHYRHHPDRRGGRLRRNRDRGASDMNIIGTDRRSSHDRRHSRGRALVEA